MLTFVYLKKYGEQKKKEERKGKGENGVQRQRCRASGTARAAVVAVAAAAGKAECCWAKWANYLIKSQLGAACLDGCMVNTTH